MRKVQKAVIPATLKSLGIGVFSASGIESVVIEYGFTVIPERTFESCKKLSSVTLPSNIEEISSSAFTDCVLIKDVGELPGLKK